LGVFCLTQIFFLANLKINRILIFTTRSSMLKNLFGHELWKRVFFRSFLVIITVSFIWQATGKNILLTNCILLPFMFMFYSHWIKESKKVRTHQNGSLENQFFRIESILSHTSFVILCALTFLIIQVHSERKIDNFDRIIDIFLLAWIVLSIIVIDFEARWYLPSGWKTDTYNLKNNITDNDV